MNQRRVMGWLIAAVYTALIVFGVIYLIEMEVTTSALVLVVAGVVTTVIALLALKDNALKISFFVSGLLLINIAVGYSWKELEPMFRVLGGSVIVGEVLYMLIRLYYGLNLPKRKLNYTANIQQLSSAQVNIQDFCKSKYHNKEEIDKCQARLIG